MQRVTLFRVGEMSHFRVLLFLVPALMLGCGPNKTSTTDTPKPAATGATADEILTSATHQLRPENFGINSNVEKTVSLLNSWRFKRVEQTGTDDSPLAPNAPAGWIVPDEEAQLSQVKFDGIDSEHIRNSMLFHTIAGYLSDRGKDESQRVASVIEFVCRNVSLWKDDEVEIPVNPFLTLQIGRGSADDRAWICAEILRQLRIDSLVLRAKSDAKETSDKWLLGVVIHQKIHLFDIYLGSPVFGGSSENNAPAGVLSDVIAHPEYLEQMSIGEPYRLTVDDLKDAVPYVICEPAYWCHRMRLLELALPASETCVVFDPLIDDEGKNGSLQRLATAGGWPVDGVKLWSHPTRQRESAKNPPEAAKRMFQQLMASFKLPIPFKQSEDGKVVFGTPESKMHRFRIDQLQGKFSEATQRYLSIRHLEVEPNPKELAPLVRMAAEDAFYWTGLCKIELEDYQGAVDLISNYLKKYDRSGKWYFSARSQLAQCYARLGQLDDAIKTLERMSSDDPNQGENKLRVKRWSAARSK